ncbi:MAG: hypothetical protein A2452_11330 [Candidatus Firestonebacteria bacterium RIFOXYC2_FULL_39_67]|nr:MAG: hypothetical protein A2536_10030 [Candidatus Firestonebacteria bacterium RIFOXYD2_FULL_39_29]OGF54538.1 MAG: hypothetical protein A2452_11330 [Candidatus Firestonebacteria bacterium RIFOXYC2_FULL_39_67]OGF57935.1 MAG: hypothetical protein A2497_04765 [Candidatus Firestonebacteria bacterium RifOxyC12_full_39_7]
MQKVKLERTESFAVLVKAYPKYFTHGKGRSIVFGKWDSEGFSVFSFGKDISVMYNEEGEIFRALGLLMVELEKNKKGVIKIRQIPPFKFRGLMLDSSRNAVMTVEAGKKMIMKLALLGYNALCFYTEDTYEVENEPLIGYLRGKYTMKEMKELDDYAFMFGIEMFPCIQTLGHMPHIFKHNKYFEYKDDDRCFNVRYKKSYVLLEKMMKSATKPFRSKRIHLSMDEVHGLGLGNAFLPGKVNDPRELFVKHTIRVMKLCKKLRLKPMIYGDTMVGFCGSKPFTTEQRKLIPKDLKVVYWDYYSTKKEVYDNYIKQYEAAGFNPMISPGIWNWHRLWPIYPKAENNLDLFMPVASEHGITESLITAWGDDGNEAPFDASWPALVLHSEYCWSKKADKGLVKKQVKIISGNSFEALVSPWVLDVTDKKSAYLRTPVSVGRAFLYDDPITGIFSGHAFGRKLNPYYEKAYKTIKSAITEEKENKDLLSFPLLLADVLRLKADFKQNAYKAYNSGNNTALKKMVKDAGELKKRIKKLWQVQRIIWLKERKPFGLDVLDLRYAGLLGRLDVFKERVNEYLSGKIDSIPELEEKPQKCYGDFPFCSLKFYKDLACFHIPI